MARHGDGVKLLWVWCCEVLTDREARHQGGHGEVEVEHGIDGDRLSKEVGEGAQGGWPGLVGEEEGALLVRESSIAVVWQR